MKKEKKRMKRHRGIGACILAILMMVGGFSAASAEEAAKAEVSKPTAAVDVGVFSQYIWRGLEMSHNSVVIEPSVTLGYEGFSFNVWGNMDTDRKTRGSDFSEAKYTETDYTLSYSKTLGMVKLTGGYIYYALDSMQDSQELFASATLNTLLSPTLTIYREIAHAPAWYLNFGLSHSLPVVDKITFDLAASAGYYYSDDDDFSEVNNPENRYRTFHNGLLSAGFTIPFGEYFSVKPMIAYSFPLSSTADDYIKATSIGDSSNFLYGGVTFSMAF
jgi:hypothetical protein